MQRLTVFFIVAVVNFNGNLIFAIKPAAQVDQFAAVGAKWERAHGLVIGRGLNGRFTGGASHETNAL
jgi:hypothetical protein